MLNNSKFCTFFWCLFRWGLWNVKSCFFNEVEIKIGFLSKNILLPIRQILTPDFERVSMVYALVSAADKDTKRLLLPSNWVNLKLCNSRKIHCQTSEFHVKFYLKNQYHTYCFTRRAKFDIEFTRQAVNFSIVLRWGIDVYQ